jgi:hypothetical protein
VKNNLFRHKWELAGVPQWISDLLFRDYKSIVPELQQYPNHLPHKKASQCHTGAEILRTKRNIHNT